VYKDPTRLLDTELPTGSASPTTRREQILATLRSLLAEALPAAPSAHDSQVPFLEMGANSLMLMEIQRQVESRYHITIAIGQFFEALTTLDALATYIDQQLPPAVAGIPVGERLPQPSPEPSALPSIPAGIALNLAEPGPALAGPAASELEQLFSQQLQAATVAVTQVVSQQLAFLRDSGLALSAGPGNAVLPAPAGAAIPADRPAAPVNPPPSSPPPARAAVSPQFQSSPLEIRARGLTARQQRHLEALITRYTARTRTSKAQTQRYRPVLADSRAAVGFRFTTKEMLYPIVGQRARGARLWDVDGNEYLDLTMGQGVTLFGHHPAFIEAALAAEPADVVQLGPRSPRVGEVAELITEFTGLERVTFTNSGTEAVMAALRLARAATGRHQIVLFEYAYHGHADSTMARPEWRDGVLQAVPLTRGTPPGAVQDLWILEYGSDQALEFIRAHASELAAVLVEPVQSRRPEVQPGAFLQELRRLTRAAGVALIFDEMITGFRVHPGGAQAWFGVKADIATYGKVIGGGMPIGVVAGKAEYMDGIDGGLWQYGDSSYPQTERVGFGGTFCMHPLTMTTTLATLQYLQAHSPGLQERLNRQTTRLAETLNCHFAQEDVPIRLTYFGSLFRFDFASNLELLFYHLIEKGIFIWEWRNCFLSTAHTDADIDTVIDAVKETVEELRAGEFLPAHSADVIPLRRVAEPEPALPPQPLSEAQAQLWALTQLSEAGSIAYNLCVSIQLQGPLRLEALRQAVHQVVERHEALRTVIRDDAQHILPNLTLEVPLLDFSAHPASEAAVKDWFDQETRTPFDLSTGPLVRVQLLKLTPYYHWLVLTAHHIVIDGVSIDLILQEIAACYTAVCQGQACRLKPPLQFRDYVQWQIEQSQTPAMAAQEAYWLQQFADTIPVLQLPSDRPHPAVRSYRGSREMVHLDAGLCERLKKLSQQQGCTPFMTFLAVYLLLLHRLSGQDDLVVGIPTAGRSLPGGERLVGYCTHLLPIRSRLAQPTFAGYLKALRGVLLEAYQHQDYPYARLIQKLNLHWDGGKPLLVSAAFNLDQPSAAPKLFELESRWASQTVHFTDFDIIFNLTEIAADVTLECTYNSDLFFAATVTRFLGYYQNLLSAVVANPEQAIDKLSLLSAAERQRLLYEWNATQADYPCESTVIDLFEAQVAKTPQATAVVFEDQVLSYAELNARANQLAHYLQGLGVGPEVRVGLCLERSLALVIGLWGILKAGAAYVPLDPGYPAERLAFMLQDAQVAVLLTQARLQERLKDAWPGYDTAHCFCLDDDAERWAQYPVTNPSCGPAPEHQAYAIYTSGSTGWPKGVLVCHRNLLALLQGFDCVAPPRAPVNATAVCPFSFDVSVWEYFLPPCNGGTLHLLPAEVAADPRRLADYVGEHRITTAYFPPALLDPIAEYWEQSSQPWSLERMLVGVEPIPQATLQRYRNLSAGLHIVNGYGPTETTICATFYRFQAAWMPQRPTPIGTAVAGYRVYLLDHHGEPVPISVPGELYIGGAGLARGYLNRPGLTAERFVPDPFGAEPGGRLYRTGDLARWLPDGNIEFLGRIDHQVKLRGSRIELGEIEAVLASHEAVREAVVMVHGEGDRRCLVAYGVAAAEGLEAKTLRAYLAAWLPESMVPAQYVWLERLPLTPNGKVDRRALQELDVPRVSEAAFAAPRTPEEEQLAGIWAEVLNLDRVGIHDNFFELGGHSLLATRVLSRIRKTFSINSPPGLLFEAPTVADLAERIAALRGVAPAKATAMQERENIEL
jgi:amino acid adenylation domain-containing protein